MNSHRAIWAWRAAGLAMALMLGFAVRRVTAHRLSEPVHEAPKPNESGPPLPPPQTPLPATRHSPPSQTTDHASAAPKPVSDFSVSAFQRFSFSLPLPSHAATHWPRAIQDEALHARELESVGEVWKGRSSATARPWLAQVALKNRSAADVLAPLL